MTYFGIWHIHMSWHINMTYSKMKLPKQHTKVKCNLFRKRFLWICGQIHEKYIKMFIFSKVAGSRGASRKADLFDTFMWLLRDLFSVPYSFTLTEITTEWWYGKSLKDKPNYFFSFPTDLVACYFLSVTSQWSVMKFESIIRSQKYEVRSVLRLQGHETPAKVLGFL